MDRVLALYAAQTWGCSLYHIMVPQVLSGVILECRVRSKLVGCGRKGGKIVPTIT